LRLHTVWVLRFLGCTHTAARLLDYHVCGYTRWLLVLPVSLFAVSSFGLRSPFAVCGYGYCYNTTGSAFTAFTVPHYAALVATVTVGLLRCVHGYAFFTYGLRFRGCGLVGLHTAWFTTAHGSAVTSSQFCAVLVLVYRSYRFCAPLPFTPLPTHTTPLHTVGLHYTGFTHGCGSFQFGCRTTV